MRRYCVQCGKSFEGNFKGDVLCSNDCIETEVGYKIKSKDCFHCKKKVDEDVFITIKEGGKYLPAHIICRYTYLKKNKERAEKEFTYTKQQYESYKQSIENFDTQIKEIENKFQKELVASAI